MSELTVFLLIVLAVVLVLGLPVLWYRLVKFTVMAQRDALAEWSAQKTRKKGQ